MVSEFPFDSWTAWVQCSGSFGVAPPAGVAGGLCAALTYSTDGVNQSAEISATEAVALAAAGSITASTLIFSEHAEFPYDAWTAWSECCQCFGGSAAGAATAAVCSSLYHAGDPDVEISVAQAQALLEAGTINGGTLIFSDQPAFDFDEWTAWSACSFCFGIGEREAALAVAAHVEEAGQRTCTTLFYSTDGESQSDELSAETAHELAAAGTITPATLIFSQQAGFAYDGWTAWSECSHCFPPPSAPHVAPRAAVCYGWLEKKGGDTYIDAANVLRKERNYLKGGRRNWKRRWFVLHSDGELCYYSSGPKEGTGEVVPHYVSWKGRLMLTDLVGGSTPIWHVRDDSEEFLLELPKAAGDIRGVANEKEQNTRNAMLLRTEDATEKQIWLGAVVETFGATVAELLHEGEGRGVAERAVTNLRAALAVAGGGLRGEAARLPADQAVALFDFVAEQEGDLGFKKGQKLQLQNCKGEWWTGQHLEGGAGLGAFPSTFVARGKAVPAKAPPQAAAVPAVPTGSVPGVPAIPAAPTPAAVSEGVPPSPGSASDVMLAARFARYDVNEDGVLGLEEVGTLMKEMGFAADDAYIAAMMQKFDRDGDGVLQCGEFGPLFDFLRVAVAAAAACGGQ